MIRSLLPVLVVSLCVPCSGSAQSSSLAPDGWVFGLGVGLEAPKTLSFGSCHPGLPLIGAVGASWHILAPLRIEAEALVLGTPSVSAVECADLVACPPDEPCLRSEGVGTPLLASAMRVAFEPMAASATSSLRVSLGIGRFVGEGVWYHIVGGGLRFGRVPGRNVLVELEGWFFDAPERRFDTRDPDMAPFDVRMHRSTVTVLRVSIR